MVMENNMVLKILGNWEYKPESNGNNKMVIVFRRLSGLEELNLGINGEDSIKTERFKASIVEIKEPFKLEMPDGKVRDMTVEDIYLVPELSDLYFELIVEYSKKTSATEDSIKKPE